MNRYILFIILLALCYSCKNNVNRRKQVVKQDTSLAKIIADTTYTTTDKEEDDDDDKPVIIKYHETYDSAKSLLQNLKFGWLDTQTVDKQHFRLRFDTIADKRDFRVEKWTGKEWKNIFSTNITDDEYTWGDLNSDGYTDFIKFYHSRHYTYFYNPAIKSFNYQPCIMPEEYTTIDTASKLMYNYYEAMYGNLLPSSQLYTYKNLDAYFYYSLFFVDTAANNLKELKLYRYNNGRYDDTTYVKTIATGKKIKFTYKDFWTENYKQLMQNYYEPKQ